MPGCVPTPRRSSRASHSLHHQDPVSYLLATRGGHREWRIWRWRGGCVKNVRYNEWNSNCMMWFSIKDNISLSRSCYCYQPKLFVNTKEWIWREDIINSSWGCECEADTNVFLIPPNPRDDLHSAPAWVIDINGVYPHHPLPLPHQYNSISNSQYCCTSYLYIFTSDQPTST